MRVKRCAERCSAKHLWYKGSSASVATPTFGSLLSDEDDDGKMRNDGVAQPRLLLKRVSAVTPWAYRAWILLVAREQMRHATCLETAAAEDTANDMDLVGQREDKSYHDIADENAEPRTEPRSRQRDFAIEDGMAVHPRAPLEPGVMRAI